MTHREDWALANSDDESALGTFIPQADAFVADRRPGTPSRRAVSSIPALEKQAGFDHCFGLKEKEILFSLLFFFCMWH